VQERRTARGKDSHSNGRKSNLIIRMFAFKRWIFPSDKLFVTVLSMGDISDPTTKSQIYDTWANSLTFTVELSKEPRQVQQLSLFFKLKLFQF